MTDTFRLCQHNIGPTSYYDTRGKDNKMLFIDLINLLGILKII